jgi:hypothetical protein
VLGDDAEERPTMQEVCAELEALDWKVVSGAETVVEFAQSLPRDSGSMLRVTKLPKEERLVALEPMLLDLGIGVKARELAFGLRSAEGDAAFERVVAQVVVTHLLDAVAECVMTKATPSSFRLLLALSRQRRPTKDQLMACVAATVATPDAKLEEVAALLAVCEAHLEEALELGFEKVAEYFLDHLAVPVLGSLEPQVTSDLALEVLARQHGCRSEVLPEKARSCIWENAIAGQGEACAFATAIVIAEDRLLSGVELCMTALATDARRGALLILSGILDYGGSLGEKVAGRRSC